jgi:hypothetical protein
MELRAARSQPFAFALMLGWGTPAGVVALGACSVLADLLAGRAARKVLFNSAQLATALGAAGLVYTLAGGAGAPGDPPGQVSLPAFAAAALAFFVVNNLLVEAVLVLAGGTPALGRVRQGVGLRAWVSAKLLGMAPVVAVVAQTSPRGRPPDPRQPARQRGQVLARPRPGPPGGDPLRPAGYAGRGGRRPRRPGRRPRAHLRALHPARLGGDPGAGGVGLGLYIARQLSQTQGGELLVTDTTPPGLGARFELRLPLAGPSPAPVLAYAASRR